jgi:hypothetical protein
VLSASITVQKTVIFVVYVVFVTNKPITQYLFVFLSTAGVAFVEPIKYFMYWLETDPKGLA